jgi:hypothetical protein
MRSDLGKIQALQWGSSAVGNTRMNCRLRGAYGSFVLQERCPNSGGYSGVSKCNYYAVLLGFSCLVHNGTDSVCDAAIRQNTHEHDEPTPKTGNEQPRKQMPELERRAKRRSGFHFPPAESGACSTAVNYPGGIPSFVVLTVRRHSSNTRRCPVTLHNCLAELIKRRDLHT